VLKNKVRIENVMKKVSVYDIKTIKNIFKCLIQVTIFCINNQIYDSIKKF